MKKSFVFLLLKCFLSFTIIFLFLIAEFWYMLLVSDIPVFFTSDEYLLEILIFAIILLLLMIHERITYNNHLPRSGLLLLTGFFWLVVWIKTMITTNFKLGDELINLYEKNMVWMGITVSFLLFLSQIIPILCSISLNINKKRKIKK